MKEALYWSTAIDGAVQCNLCPHRCSIANGAKGICGVRFNKEGKLYSPGYGAISAIALDPIEKKPLYCFHPRSKILSIGGFGCNLRCPFCQNYEISMDRSAIAETCGSDKCVSGNPGNGTTGNRIGRRGRKITPEDIVAAASDTIPKGNIGVAYTYNEPLINFEFLKDCATLINAAGLNNVIVTNGFIDLEPLEDILPFIDAMNIDLKSFSDDFYKKAGGRLEPVLKTIEASVKQCHIEVTTLVIPGENEDDVKEIAKWLASIDPDIPLHLSRFFPNYLYSDRAPTTRESILKLQETASMHLNRVYSGNM